MDFSTIDLVAASDEGAACHIEHPVTSEPLFQKNGDPVSIRVLGQDSRRFRAIVSAISERANGRRKPLSLDAAEAQAIDTLVKMTLGWEGIEWEGQPLECTRENVRMLLTALPPIRVQLDRFIAERSNFFTSSAPN